MKKQFFVLGLTVAMITNPLAALAANSDSGAIPGPTANANVDAKELSELIPSVDTKTAQALGVTLGQVEKMISDLKAIDTANEKDPILRFLNTMQIVIVGMNATAAKVHWKNAKGNDVLLLLSTASGAVDAAIRMYKRSGKVDPTELSKILLDASEDLRKSGVEPVQFEDINKSLRDVRSVLLKNQSQLTSVVEDLNGPFGVGDVATILSFGYLIFHIFAPKAVVAEADGVLKVAGADLKEVNSVFQQVSQKLNQVSNSAKATSQAGLSLGGIPDLLSMIFGMNSTTARNMTLETIDNLSKAANDIQAQIDTINQRMAKP